LATLTELLRTIPHGFVVLGGAVGLGRGVSRVIHLRPAEVTDGSVGDGDLVVYAATPAPSAADREPDRALLRLLVAGAAGVLTDVEPNANEVRAADKYGCPLLVSIGGIETEQLRAGLTRSLAIHESLVDGQTAQLQQTMADLARAGLTPAMLLERLVAMTGKAGLLKVSAGGIEYAQQPILQDLDRQVLRRGVESSAATVQHWLSRARASDCKLLYVELPAERLVRLVASIWVEGTLHADLSLFARPDDLATRDRMALVAAADAIATAYAHPALDVAAVVGRRRCAGVVLRAAEASSEDLASAARQHFESSRMALTSGMDDVRLCIAFDAVDRIEWTARLCEWQRQLLHEFGPVSIGHAVRMGAQASDVRYALAQATEAVLVGERLFGPGHVTSYADAQLSSFLLGRRETYELRALFEQVVGKLAAEDSKRDRELVRTLEIYCETFSTQRTADRLQVHRNTVLYRLRQIEEITSFDLEDGQTRLLLQLGLLAGRLARKSGEEQAATPAARLGTARAMQTILSA
jgi:hypothetical protein